MQLTKKAGPVILNRLKKCVMKLLLKCFILLIFDVLYQQPQGRIIKQNGAQQPIFDGGSAAASASQKAMQEADDAAAQEAI